ncbi:MAG: SDR family oxidoreductase [Pseudomonadota bacterium]
MLKPVLVTGASSGIGAAISEKLAASGFRVYAAARRADKLDVVAAHASGRITPLVMDVTDAGSIDRALENIADDGSTLFGLVNNAGLSVTGPLESTDTNEWRRLYETNVFGVVELTKAVLPQMRGVSAGRIINIGSIAGRIATPFFSPYASSKHALEGLSDSLRREVAPFGIDVSLVRPGFIRTDFGDQEQAALEPHTKDGLPYAAAVKAFKSWHAKGHPNAPRPSVVADCVHHALTVTHPKARYTAPLKYAPQLFLRNFAPVGLTDALIARITGISAAQKRSRG